MINITVMRIPNSIKTGCLALAALALVSTGCKKVLDSEYRSDIGPEYFSTPEGLQSGVSASYSISRFFWGSEGFAGSAVAGTDEVVRGGDGGNEFHQYIINPQNGSIQGIWDNSYIAINNVNGVLELGPNAAMDANRKAALLAEAKFLRGFYYFLLVQNFGDVPLNLTFNTVPTTVAKRTPVKEVYNAIIKDLTEASQELSDKPLSLPSKGRASKSAALHLLAKVYLTKGWNVNAREGDGKSDFDNAYATAEKLINNKALYGVDLEQDFADVHRPGNEYGKESIFVIDRNMDAAYSESGYNNTTAVDGNRENRSNHYWVSFYTLARDVNAGIPGAPVSNAQLVTRDVNYGRPFRRFRPTQYTYNTFNNRESDSRYDKSFQKVWIYNRPTSGSVGQDPNTNPINVTTSRGTLIRNVDTAIYMPGREVTVAERLALKGVIVAPSQYDAEWFPSLLKHLDPTRMHYNDPSDRPIILFRLADTYLLAAEAAFKGGRSAEAAAMINVVRKRAAYRTSNTPAQNDAAVAAMTISAGDVNIDFILDERTRELYGEYNRWYDLVRTQSLIRRVQLYNPVAGPLIKDFHVLRPIPSATQLDLLTNKAEFPQNPGY
jgi:hypothetical protein